MKKKFLTILITIFAVCMCMFTLTACEEKEPQHTHVYDQQVVKADFKKSDATCEEKAKYYYSCSCGAKGTETFENGMLGDHSYDTLKKNETEHWNECICGKKENIENHNPGAQATEETDQICTECNYVIVPALGHIHTLHLTKVDALPQSCTTDGNIEYYICSCNKWFTDNTATTEITDKSSVVIQKEEHSFTNYISNNDAKCLEDGTETSTCDREGCNETHTRNQIGSALDHNYSKWVSNGNDTHTKTCSNDNTHTITEECSGGTATCTEKAKCEDCDAEYGTLEEHNHNALKYNQTQHWYECECGDAIGEEDHTMVKDGEKFVCEYCDYSPQGKVSDAQWTNATRESIFDNITFEYTMTMSSMTQANNIHIANGMLAVQMSEIKNYFVEDYMYYYDEEAEANINSYKTMLLAFVCDNSKYTYDEAKGAYILNEDITVTVSTNGYVQTFTLRQDSLLKFNSDGYIESIEGKLGAQSGSSYNVDLYWSFSDYGTTVINVPSAGFEIPDLEFGKVDMDSFQDLLFITEDNVQYAQGKCYDDEGRVIEYSTDTAIYSGDILKNGIDEYIVKENGKYYQYYVDDQGNWKKIKYEHIYDEEDFYRESDFRPDYFEQDIKNIKYNEQTGLYELASTEYYSSYGPCENLKFGFVDGKLRYFYFEHVYDFGGGGETQRLTVSQVIDYRTEIITLPEINRLLPSVPNDYFYSITGEWYQQESTWASAMENQVFSHEMERIVTISKDGEFVSERVETILVYCFGTTVMMQIGDDEFYVSENRRYYSILKNDNDEWVKTYITGGEFEKLNGSGNFQGYFEYSVYEQVESDYYSNGLYIAKDEKVTTQYGEEYYNFMVGFDNIRRISYLTYQQEIDGNTVMSQYYVNYTDVKITLPTNVIEPAE